MVADYKRSPNEPSEAVMVLMSTTQATVCIVAALFMAALLGALIFWLTVAYEPFGELKWHCQVLS